MTLLESIVAFIVLGLVGLACLDLSRGAMQLQQTSAQTTQAVMRAESAIAAVRADLLAETTGGVTATAERAPIAITTRAWREGANASVINVSVPLAGGGTFQLSRIVRRRAVPPRVAVARVTP